MTTSCGQTGARRPPYQRSLAPNSCDVTGDIREGEWSNSGESPEVFCAYVLFTEEDWETLNISAHSSGLLVKEVQDVGWNS